MENKGQSAEILLKNYSGIKYINKFYLISSNLISLSINQS